MATATKKPEIKPRKYGSFIQINEALAELKAERAEHEKLTAKLKAAVAKAQTEHGVPAEQTEITVQEIEQGIDAFVHARRDQLNGEEGNRSLKLENGVVGLRWGPPKLCTMSKVTWEKVLQNALGLPGAIRKLFVKEENSLDKKALLKAIREDQITDAVRRSLGVDARQEEYAVIEPD